MKRTVATFLVAYDAAYLRTSLPLVYDHVDKIILSIDRERRTWSGGSFELPADFFDWVNAVDRAGKITIYQDSFFIPGKDPLYLDSRQRQMSAEHAGLDNTWHIQVDADEYFLDFKALVDELRQEEQRRDNCDGILYFGRLIPLFKQDETGFYYVDNGHGWEPGPVAASNPRYIAARKTECVRRVTFDVYIIHQTFARDSAELRRKMKNWGHSKVFDADSYLALWKAIDRNNCKYIANFNPSWGPGWKKLQYVEATDIDEFIRKMKPEITARQADVARARSWKPRFLMQRAWKRVRRFVDRCVGVG